MVKKTEPAASLPRMEFELGQMVSDTWAWINNHSLQLLIAFVAATLIVGALIGLRSLGLSLCRRDRSGTHWAITLGKALSKTRMWFMVPLAAQLVSRYAVTPDWLSHTIRFVFIITTSLQVAIWVRELILGVIAHRAGTNGDHVSGLGNALGIIRLLVTIAVFAIAIILILDNLGVNVTGLVAGLGIGGIAIGLAAQGIFSDLFAALSILFDKPFQKGDGIKFDQTSGSVEAIGLKTTRIRALTGEEVVISNTNLLNKELHNMTRLHHRRYVHMLGVIYQTPVEQLDAIPGMVRAIIEGEKDTAFVRCGMTGFGQSSIDFELQYDMMGQDFEQVFAANHRILIGILRTFNEARIEFAYPTQTSFTAAPDGRAIMPYPDISMLTDEVTGRPVDAQDAKPPQG